VKTRITLIIILLTATMYAATGLFTSLTHFAVGVCVAMLCLTLLGLLDWLRDHCDDRRNRIAAARARHPAGHDRVG